MKTKIFKILKGHDAEDKNPVVEMYVGMHRHPRHPLLPYHEL
jgi:hypothetical protein